MPGLLPPLDCGGRGAPPKIFALDTADYALPFFARHYYKRAPNFESDSFSTEAWLQRAMVNADEYMKIRD